jgi:hypothetical protein
MVPMIKREEALHESLKYRVYDNVNNKVPSPSFETWVNEFLELLIPDDRAGAGVPLSSEEVIAEMDKPTQVLAIARIIETMDMKPKARIAGFLKKEPCNKPGRIISSYPDARFLVQLSQFTLALRNNVLHKQVWFSPGRTPKQIARQVCNYVRSLTCDPIEGDYSSFDGTVSPWLQHQVINAAYLRYFGGNPELRKLLNYLVSCPAKAKRFDFAYEAGPGIKSGSPTTCDGNTILNAFLMYCAVRRADPYLEPHEAYRFIGLAFGDDSVFSQRYASAFNWVAKAVGMKLKIVKYNPEQGLTYLARVFPLPGESTTSFQDPIRTMRKLHLTSRNRNVPLADAAMDRVEGYLVTDSRTPIISEYCRKVIESYAGDASDDRHLRADRNVDKPYYSLKADNSEIWPQLPEDDAAVMEVLSCRMGIAKAQVEAIQGHIAGLVHINDLRTANITCEQYADVYAETVMPDGVVLTSDGDRTTIKDGNKHAEPSTSSHKPVQPARPESNRQAARGVGNAKPYVPKGRGVRPGIPNPGWRRGQPNNRSRVAPSYWRRYPTSDQCHPAAVRKAPLPGRSGPTDAPSRDA